MAIQGLFAVIVAFVFFEALRGHHFWSKIKGEGNLWNYGSSLVYFVAGEMAIVNAILLRCHGGVRRRSWGWMVWVATGAAFVFFACDEMLIIHEKLGLAMERSMPWLGQIYSGRADNLFTAAYAAGAVLFALVFFRGLLGNRKAKAYFIAGLAMAAAASSLDIIPRRFYISRLPFREMEELLEVFAGFSFTAAFISAAAVALLGILSASADVENGAVSKVEEEGND